MEQPFLISVSEAEEQILAGHVIAYPTEAVYGLGCDPFNKVAFDRLLQLKNRSLEKGVILIAASVAQLEELVEIQNQPWTQAVLESWQDANQPMTWVLPSRPRVPTWLTGGRSTLAVRVTHHRVAKALCEQFKKPLVSTSANISGEMPIRSAADCEKAFPGLAIVKGDLMGQAQPSQIWDAETMTRLR
ncbi:tRNA threonylcarbamoyladenosine biosynthesis protein RimN [Hydrogenovibrio sp. SC-1]|uniref:L-threonylcarbamoyladenylate synthase n=1 Tax=Hydrogenovibrio sp. SC-1 TaxID=2065820 RepID=UPI000C7DC3C4|nr:Sua5/YciO/YrdC/YwlC family protein [Hydrogenovibrio sp. SC-1]PLA75374.1 tRNA threonylcarbamoyladenosine biosynthesis protein RimN [Hydrogenovibrio sp. SC-1]